MTDNYIHLIFKVKAIQKCQPRQLCVLRENWIECDVLMLKLSADDSAWRVF